MDKILFATNNEHKVMEVRKIFDSDKIISLKEAGIDIDVEETGSTFEENALIKARTIYNLVNMPVLADDSGLTVNALNGRPGIYSARYAGVHGDDKANYMKLINELKGVSDRRAEYNCVVAFICYQGEFISEGKVEGEILLGPSGNEGFGYDPIFYSYELKKSFGNATIDEKNLVSHRFRAVRGLKEILLKNNIILS